MDISLNKYDMTSAFEITQLLMKNEWSRREVFNHLLRVIQAKLLVGRGVILVAWRDKFVIESIKGVDSDGSRTFASLEEAKSVLGLSHTFAICINDVVWGHLCLGRSRVYGLEYSEDQLLFVNAVIGFIQISIHFDLFAQKKSDLLKSVNKSIQRMVSLFDLSQIYQLTESKDYAVRTFYWILAAEFLISRFIAFSLNKVDEKAQPKVLLNIGDVNATSDIREWLDHAPLNALPYTEIDHVDFSVRCFFEIGDEQIIILLGRNKHNHSGYAKEFIMLALQQLKYFWHYKYIIEQTVKQAIEKRAREEEMRIASETQRALLPSVQAIDGVDLFAFMAPSKEVGGDYFEMLPLSSTRFFVAIADVCGKGISAAMLMANLQASLRVLLLNDVSPTSLSLTVEKLNMALHQSLTRDKFITMSCAVINIVEKTITSLNAGHNAPFLITKNNQVKRLSKGGTILGAFPNLTYEVECLNYNEGDLLFFYTDGVTEVRNEANEEFGEDRLLSILMTNRHELTSEQMVATIQDNMKRFINARSATYFDDVAMLCVKFNT